MHDKYEDEDPAELPTERRRRQMRERLHLQKRQLRAEAREQGGNPRMHDDPSRENRMVFRAADLPIREPDAIKTAEEIEKITMGRERQVHDDGDFEVIDDIEDLERQDFEVI